jgi:hypothetical protein
MTSVSAAETGPNPSRQLIELLGKALIDNELRDKLFADPEAVARSFDLSPKETEAIKRLDRQEFERAAVDLRWS